MNQREMFQQMLECKHAAFFKLVEQRLESIGYDLAPPCASYLVMIIPTIILFEAMNADELDAGEVLDKYETLDDTIEGAVSAMMEVT